MFFFEVIISLKLRGKLKLVCFMKIHREKKTSKIMLTSNRDINE